MSNKYKRYKAGPLIFHMPKYIGVDYAKGVSFGIKVHMMIMKDGTKKIINMEKVK